jgi:hypothetical protein
VVKAVTLDPLEALVVAVAGQRKQMQRVVLALADRETLVVAVHQATLALVAVAVNQP